MLIMIKMIEKKERMSEEKGKRKNYEKRKFHIFAKKSLGVRGLLSVR